MDELARAMAPTDKVLDAFARELSPCNQHDFALRIQDMWNDFGPSKRYLRNLVRRFIRGIEAEGQAVEDENLLLLVLKCSQSSDVFPDPDETGYQSFRLLGDETDDEPLRVRVYPQHNDVALRLWEAGGVLSEYLIKYPFHVSGKAVLETGAGVGLTGLVAARYCGATKVLMTDYTVACLVNLSHNITLNESWLRKAHGSPEVTQGFLDWNSYAADDYKEQLAMDSTFQFFQIADVLLAADVVYDVDSVPILGKLVERFLSSGRDRNSIFATTLRNRKTFDLFEAELLKHKITCRYEDASTIANLPNFFPIYHVQPRLDTRICIMTLDGSKKELGNL